MELPVNDATALVDELICVQNYLAALRAAEQALLDNPDDLEMSFKSNYCAAWLTFDGEDWARAGAMIQVATSCIPGQIQQECPCVIGEGETKPTYRKYLDYLQRLVNAGVALDAKEYQTATNECGQAQELNLPDSAADDLMLLCYARQVVSAQNKDKLLLVIHQMQDGWDFSDLPEDFVSAKCQLEMEWRSKFFLAQVYMWDEKWGDARIALDESQESLQKLKERFLAEFPEEANLELYNTFVRAYQSLLETRGSDIAALRKKITAANVETLIADNNYLAALREVCIGLSTYPSDEKLRFLYDYCAAWCLYDIAKYDLAIEKIASAAKFTAAMETDCPCVIDKESNSKSAYKTWLEYLTFLVKVSKTLKDITPITSSKLDNLSASQLRDKYGRYDQVCQEAEELLLQARSFALNDLDLDYLDRKLLATQCLFKNDKARLLYLYRQMQEGLDSVSLRRRFTILARSNNVEAHIHFGKQDWIPGRTALTRYFTANLELAKLFKVEYGKYKESGFAGAEGADFLWKLLDGFYADLVSRREDPAKITTAVDVSMRRQERLGRSRKGEAGVNMDTEDKPDAGAALPGQRPATTASGVSADIGGNSFSLYGSSHSGSGGGGAAKPPTP
jgi:hypothetical protein